MGTKGLRPPRPERQVTNHLIAQAICRGPLETHVTAVSGVAARTGSAHVSIRYGRLLIYVEDWAALEALIEAVDRAEELGGRVLGPRGTAEETTRRAAMQRFERTGKAPLHSV